MKCKDCAYWEEPRKYDDTKTLGYCNKAKQLWDETEWQEVGDSIECVEKNPTLLMYVEDGSSYYAVLRTKPDFFCAHYEEAEEEK